MIRHTLAPMIRSIALILALMLATSSVAWASDVHEEALTGQHVSVEQDQGGGDTPAKLPAPCDHCCHGNAHHIALGDNASETAPRHPADMRPALTHQPASWHQTPPTPPPNC